MRLLNVHSYKFESYDDLNTAPPYVILSHRWGKEEVLFEDFQEQPYEKEIQDLQRKLEDMNQRFENLARQLRNGDSSHVDEALDGAASQPDKETLAERRAELGQENFNRARKKTDAWNKISGSCNEAKNLGFSYIWIDTCCIKKDSLVEVSESINSMYSWYGQAEVCIAYLSDVSMGDATAEFEKSQWFQRGWTLQELIVPDDVRFYSLEWEFLGMRSALASRIARITHIEEKVLCERGREYMSEFSVAARLSWASNRCTTKVEDRAYSLIGLFGVNMPVLYGEGETASFHRLQAEIFKAMPDQSIFAWTCSVGEIELAMESENLSSNLFARRVDYFRKSGSIESGHEDVTKMYLEKSLASRYLKFSNGTRVMLLMRACSPTVFQVCLGCKDRQSTCILAIYVTQIEPGNFRRDSEGISEILPDVFAKQDWFMEETFISPVVPAPKPRYYYQSFNRELRLSVRDQQLVKSGFAKFSHISELSQFEEILASVPYSTAKQAFEKELHEINPASHAEFSMMSKQLRLDIPSSDCSLAYLNKDTKTIFIIKLSLNTHLRKIHYHLYGMTFHSIRINAELFQPTEKDSWDLATTVVYNRIVANGWRISLQFDVKPANRKEGFLDVFGLRKELILEASRLGSLELNTKR